MLETLKGTEEKKIQIAGGKVFPGFKAIQHNDGNPITIVKESYHVCHNQQFMDLTNQMADITGFPIEGYSEFYNGNVVISHLKNNLENFKIGDNKIEDYIVLGNSHNGTKKFFVGTTSILIRCTNAFSQISNIESVKHTKSAEKRLEELLEAFKKFIEIRKRMYEKFEMFQNVVVDEEIQTMVLRKLLQIKDEDSLEDISTRKLGQYEMIENNVIAEMDDLGQNMWGFFNGVTKFTSNELTAKHMGFGNVFGMANTLNQRAFALAEEMI